jgi:hypothetical protein
VSSTLCSSSPPPCAPAVTKNSLVCVYVCVCVCVVCVCRVCVCVCVCVCWLEFFRILLILSRTKLHWELLAHCSRPNDVLLAHCSRLKCGPLGTGHVNTFVCRVSCVVCSCVVYHSLTHSLTHSLPRSLTRSLPHSQVCVCVRVCVCVCVSCVCVCVLGFYT